MTSTRRGCGARTLRTNSNRADGCQSRPLMLEEQPPQLRILGSEPLDLGLARVCCHAVILASGGLGGKLALGLALLGLATFRGPGLAVDCDLVPLQGSPRAIQCGLRARQA